MIAALKILVDIIMIITALFLIMQGLGGQTVSPFILALIGILMIVELITDMFHMH